MFNPTNTVNTIKYNTRSFRDEMKTSPYVGLTGTLPLWEFLLNTGAGTLQGALLTGLPMVVSPP